MLSQEILDKLVERIAHRIEATNTLILEEIGSTIKIIGELNPSRANQLVQILKYGGSYNKIVRQLAKVSELNIKEIEEILEEVARKNYKFAEKFYTYREKDYIPFEDNATLQTQIKAITNITVAEYTNLSKTSMLGYGLQDLDGNIVFTGLQDTFNQIIDEAVLSLREGKETFNQVMKTRMKELCRSGLKVIYPTTYIGKDSKGNPVLKHHTRRLDSAVRMNINDALNRLHNETQEIIGEQFGADGVEITAHPAPAPDHEELQGKQFSKEEYEKLNNQGRAVSYDGKVISADARRRPISELNCYHYTFSIILGVSSPSRTNEELERLKKENNKGFTFEDVHYTQYEGTQLQRKIETRIREEKTYKAMAQKTGREDEVFAANKRIRYYNKKYRELCSASGLRPHSDRLTIY